MSNFKNQGPWPSCPSPFRRPRRHLLAPTVFKPVTGRKYQRQHCTAVESMKSCLAPLDCYYHRVISIHSGLEFKPMSNNSVPATAILTRELLRKFLSTFFAV